MRITTVSAGRSRSPKCEVKRRRRRRRCRGVCVCARSSTTRCAARRRRRRARDNAPRRRRRRRPGRPGRRRRNKAHADVVIKRIERRDIVEISLRANENAHFLDKDSCVPLSMHGCVLTNCNCRVCVGTYTPWRYFEISKYLGTRDVVRPTDF
jgi:hypothetical protein